jgi:hypothetical protein
MKSTLCGRVRIWEDGRAKRHDGRTWLAQQAKIGLQRAAVRPWLAGQGELGVVANSRVPETVELATSEQCARPPAALGLARLPVSVRVTC